MVDAVQKADPVLHAGFAPGEFPPRWHDPAYEMHCLAWPSTWEGQVARDRFLAELEADHVDILYEAAGRTGDGTLLAYVKWKATEQFHLSRDRLSDPAHPSLSSAPPAAYACAYEITATPSKSWLGLGRRLMTEAMNRWQHDHGKAVLCTYSPKRGLTTALRRLGETVQYGRPALDSFAHRAGAAASRHIDEWVDRLGQPLEAFIRSEVIPTPDERIMEHLSTLSDRYGRDVIDGVVAAIGIAYNFVYRASSGLPACKPAAFHRALGAEHWRQYPASALNCADALGLVDHWRYSHDPARREKCAKLFKEHCAAGARPTVSLEHLIVLV